MSEHISYEGKQISIQTETITVFFACSVCFLLNYPKKIHFQRTIYVKILELGFFLVLIETII